MSHVTSWAAYVLYLLDHLFNIWLLTSREVLCWTRTTENVLLHLLCNCPTISKCQTVYFIYNKHFKEYNIVRYLHKFIHPKHYGQTCARYHRGGMSKCIWSELYHPGTVMHGLTENYSSVPLCILDLGKEETFDRKCFKRLLNVWLICISWI